MLKNGQTYFKNLAVLAPQDFESMFGHFSTLWNKGLMSFSTKNLSTQKCNYSTNKMRLRIKDFFFFYFQTMQYDS